MRKRDERERGNLSHIDELLHSSLGHEAIDRDVSRLSEPVSSVLCLHVQGGVPVAVEDDHLRGWKRTWGMRRGR
jgi:hypothetical protein